MRGILIAALFLAAPGTVKLAYRFPKGLVYTETTKRSILLQTVVHGPTVGTLKGKSDASSVQSLRRTILEADDDGRPIAERVEVLQFVRTVRASPSGSESEGVHVDPAQGRTFVWRKKGSQFHLYDEKGDVTDAYPRLVEQLRPWRDARLPKKPVAVGDEWNISAATFLETSGAHLPPGEIDGTASFHVDSLKDGVADITFHFDATVNGSSVTQTWKQKGTWRFDYKRGRDLELKATVDISMKGATKATGTGKIERTVTYP